MALTKHIENWILFGWKKCVRHGFWNLHLNVWIQLLWASFKTIITLRWRHNEWDGVSNHQPHDYLLNRLSGRRSKKTPKPRVTGLYAGNSPGTGELPAQMASYAETVSIWWRHHKKRSHQHERCIRYLINLHVPERYSGRAFSTTNI